MAASIGSVATGLNARAAQVRPALWWTISRRNSAVYLTNDSMGTSEKSWLIISLVASEDEELELPPPAAPGEVVFVALPGSGHPPRVHWQEMFATQPRRLPTMTLLGLGLWLG